MLGTRQNSKTEWFNLVRQNLCCRRTW